jgi:hypothetical protein
VSGRLLKSIPSIHRESFEVQEDLMAVNERKKLIAVKDIESKIPEESVDRKSQVGFEN